MDNEFNSEQTMQSRLQNPPNGMDAVIPSVVTAFRIVYQALQDGRTLYTCGNGGSHSDAQHIVGELMKAFELSRPIGDDLRHQLQAVEADSSPGNMDRVPTSRPSESARSVTSIADRLTSPIRAIALGTNNALSSAIANDQGQDLVFAQELLGLGKPGDVLLGISTSGASENVVRAVQVARALGLHTVALTGRDPSTLSEMADVSINVPATGSAPVQEMHIRVYHTLCAALEIAFFAD